MMLKMGLGPLYIWGAAWTLALLLLTVAFVVAWRTTRRKPKSIPKELETKIVNALSIYLCGNRDMTAIRLLAADHPDAVRETVLHYQTAVAGRREDLCELAIMLGLVQAWYNDTESADVEKRRKAFAAISTMAHYEPVRRIVGDITAKVFRDPDDQVRADVARILLASGGTKEVNEVFEAAIVDTAFVRSAISSELAHHSVVLCENAIPWALRAENPLEVLKMLVSWERALPLTNVSWLTRNPDPAVRLQAMRLLRYLPATSQNQATVRAELCDPDAAVREAAAEAIPLGRPRTELTADAAAGGLESVQPATSVDPAAGLAVAAGPCLKTPDNSRSASFKTLAEPFAKWRLPDAKN